MAIIGCVDILSRSRVLGWAANTAKLNESVIIQIFVDGEIVAALRADRERPKLREALGGGATGRYEFLHDFTPPLSIFRPSRVDVKVDGYPEALTGGTAVFPAPTPPPAPIVPIIITSTGRSGTTLLMRELSMHPAIVVADRYPYEIKMCSYYSAAFRALASNEDRERSTDPASVFGKENRYNIGHNPYNSPQFHGLARRSTALFDHFEREIPSQYAKLFRDFILNFYSILKHDQQKLSAPFFAEKGDLDDAARSGVRMMFGRVREIVLVRDPRDLVCSGKAFWNLTTPASIEMLTSTIPALMRIRNDADADTYFVRYEDLVRDPVATREAMYRFVGVDPQRVSKSGADRAILDVHATSADPRRSLSRWREELTTEEIASCNVLFADYIAAWEYEAGDDGAHSPVLVFQGTVAHERAHCPASRPLNGEPTQLDQVWAMDFRKGAGAEPALARGWSHPEADGTWSSARESELVIPAHGKGPWLVRIVSRPFVFKDVLPVQRVQLSANGAELGSVTLSNHAMIEVEVPAAVSDPNGEMRITLGLPDAARPKGVNPASPDDRLLGLLLIRVTVFAGHAAVGPNAGDAPSPPAPVATRQVNAANYSDFANLMLRFESMGENCEFGLVQRRCGAEPQGLLRFSSSPLPRLMAALTAKFDGVGQPHMIEVRESASGTEYMVFDKKFGFLRHAWVMIGEEAPEAIHRREARKVPELVRKLTEDLERGDKLFVYHGLSPLQQQDLERLAAEMGRYGPSQLLWVEVAGERERPGSVERIGGNLLKGYIDRFAPGENAHDLSLDCWVELCRNAEAAWKQNTPAIALSAA